MNFKVGDKVLIRSDLKTGVDYGACGFVNSQRPMLGKVATIARVFKTCYRIEEDRIEWNYTDEMIERKLEENKMTKDDLKVGYVVEYRNGGLAMVAEYVEQKAIVSDDGCYVRLSGLDDELKMKNGSSYDVMKIYGLTPEPSMSRSTKTINRKLLWERKEITELTLEEIAKKFNVPVETLRIKE